MQDFIKNKPKTGRNASFQKTMEYLYDTFGNNSINIIETGTIRGNSDTARYGDGWGTLNWKYYAEHTDSKVWSVDIDQNCINIANSVVPSDDKLSYVHSDSINFLETFPKQIDLLFLDSYDYCGDEENIRRCHLHQLNEIKAALDKMSPKGFILIDDIFDQSWTGKGKESIPFLLSNGWEVVYCFDSQILFKKINNQNTLPKVSCVMTTYGRHTCVEHSIGMFLRQDYKGEKELIILNTAIDHPYELGDSLKEYQEIIKVFNNNTDMITGKDYSNVGSIRRDAITYATGELYICWDDDDIFLPWNITQAVEGLIKSGKRAWKPRYSFFWGGGHPEYAENVMEASVIVYIDELKKRGFRPETGSEHCGWYQELVDEGKFFVDNNSIPAYCFNWSRSTGPSDHKQSGDINNPNNFENHKERSIDFGNSKLEKIEDKKLDKIYEEFYNVLRYKKENQFLPQEKESMEKYVPKDLVFISAQPDDNYFAWQVEVQIHNFRKYGYSHKMNVLVFYVRDKPNVMWQKLSNNYPEVNFFFYKNLGVKINPYIPALRPHILKQHFAIFPELSKKAIFYHDSDIMFTSYIDFTKLCTGETWHLSDTIGYIGSNYLKSKGEYIFEGMCNLIGIDKKLVEDNEENSGGAQYLMKNIDSFFWEKVEKDCIALYEYMEKCNKEDLFLREPRTDIQSWCSDMWCVLWGGLLRNQNIKVNPELNFSWATSMMDEFNRCKIYHNAGVTADRKELFYKGKYIYSLPYNINIEEFSPNYGVYKYAELVKEVGKVTCLK